MLRKSELTGYFLFVQSCFCLLDFIFAFARPTALVASLSINFCFMVFLVLLAFLNRRGRTHIASTILIGCNIITIMFIVMVVRKNSHASDLLPTYDFLLYPIIVGSLFIPRKWIWIFTLLSVAFILFDLLFLPHPIDIEQMKGTSTLILWLLRPISLLIVIAIVGWLGSRSVEQSIMRADHAEELVAAERQVAKQAYMITEQKAQLEAEMKQILHVHQEAAAGNYAVRAPVQMHGVIWQIGRSLNNLLARYEQFAREQREYGHVKADIEQIAHYIEVVRRGERLSYPRCDSLVGKRLLYAMGMPAPLPVSSEKLTAHGMSAHSHIPSNDPGHTSSGPLRDLSNEAQGGQNVPASNPSSKHRRPFDVWRKQH